jgi:hypothetical protein
MPEGGVHQFLNHSDQPARLLIWPASVTGPSAAVYPEDDTYALRVPGRTGIAFVSATSRLTTGTASRGPPARRRAAPTASQPWLPLAAAATSNPAPEPVRDVERVEHELGTSLAATCSADRAAPR